MQHTWHTFLDLEVIIIEVNNRKQKYLRLHSVLKLKVVILFCYQLLQVNIKFDVEFPSCQREKRTETKKKKYQFVKENNYFPFLALSQKGM